jgi:hypothetical protein
MEEQEYYGKLFNVIPLMNEKHIDLLLNTIDKETAVYYLTHAVNYAYINGIFTLGESEIISKSIRLLNTETPTNTDNQTD